MGMGNMNFCKLFVQIFKHLLPKSSFDWFVKIQAFSDFSIC